MGSLGWVDAMDSPEVCGTGDAARSRVRVCRPTSYAGGTMMRTTSRSIAALLFLGTAACSNDAIVAPRTAPAPLRAEAAPAPTAKLGSRARIAQAHAPASGEPLYVVNGVVQPGLPAHVDALAIDCIEVMRGAEAAARYGDRAANGVVLITTRPPKVLDRS
jgi:TonB-dependent SusC/RagA subfamily outer membrane receptor